MDVQTYFFRRTNMNALGKPRSWTDHLLWHHACHTVDLFQYQTGETGSQCYALQGPLHPELKIAMDMSIGMKVPSGAICTLSLSFNNKGPLGTFFRYICDNGTYIARYDDLVDGEQKPIDLSKVDVSMNGIELAGSRILRRHPGRARAECQRGSMPARDARRSTGSRTALRARSRAADDHRLPRPLHHRAGRAAGISRCADRGARGSGRRGRWREPQISDDEIRESLEKAQLKLQRERGTDLTIFSPRASAMGHHIGNEATSLHWARLCNDLIHRVCALYPRELRRRLPAAAVARVSRRPTASPSSSAASASWASSAATSTPIRPAATGPTRRSPTASGIRSTRRWSSSTCRRWCMSAPPATPTSTPPARITSMPTPRRSCSS